ncbi:putative ribonuclease [Leptomonas pyrrhocoris]|uniref:Putative ribonuclease n=1 Tax=Leptomonas pyrrhocoris TaxID=157538 RepID=A0A0M9GAB4_LEPPY|nr:putative ribonuclease [Leptomonas pyrrhocoris]KPA86200.1 putative ribonuclease [Leptomonas pyrrhocoris]|eukprot:XP_015664639.1 putative ribonuclease [Leptomonas pyrrhocoris]
MEITNGNAEALLPCIAAQLRECTFFAIDLEFTGLDRDSTEAGADTPDALVRSLMREPSDLYPQKLETIKPYSIIQIGFSIFTRHSAAAFEERVPSSGRGVASASDTHPAAHDLQSGVKAFVPNMAVKDYYTNFLEAAVREHEKAVDASDRKAAASFVANEMAKVGEQLVAVCGGAGARPGVTADALPYSTDSAVELLRRYHFLEVLFRLVARDSRGFEQITRDVSSTNAGATGSEGNLTHLPATVTPGTENYEVKTFTAYMFPAVLAESQNVSLKVDTAEFLVKNNIDLTRWVREGLRFKPLKNVAAALAEDGANRLHNVEQLYQPHKTLPRFADRFKNTLDYLLPFSPAELQLVKFVLQLCPPLPSLFPSQVASFYIRAVRPLLEFARGGTDASKLPSPIYTSESVSRNEMAALAAVGLTKKCRKYVRISSLCDGRSSSSSSSGGNGNDGGASSSSSFAGDGTLASSATAQGYGTALFETLLYATEVLQKPMVLYNGYSDLMFILLSLYGPQEMPPTLAAFKYVVHRHFPELYDTRILVCSGPLQELGNFTGRLQSVLEEMAKVTAVAPHVSFQFDDDFVGGSDPGLSSAAHNAGFDAMLTGKLFAYAVYALTRANTDYKLYGNFLSTYNTLLSINLTGATDGVLQEEPTPIFLLTESFGMRANSIRDALAREGLTSLVVYRGNFYTIHPVGQSCFLLNYQKLAEAKLTREAHHNVTLLPICI